MQPNEWMRARIWNPRLCGLCEWEKTKLWSNAPPPWTVSPTHPSRAVPAPSGPSRPWGRGRWSRPPTAPLRIEFRGWWHFRLPLKPDSKLKQLCSLFSLGVTLDVCVFLQINTQAGVCGFLPVQKFLHTSCGWLWLAPKMVSPYMWPLGGVRGPTFSKLQLGGFHAAILFTCLIWSSPYISSASFAGISFTLLLTNQLLYLKYYLLLWNFVIKHWFQDTFKIQTHSNQCTMSHDYARKFLDCKYHFILLYEANNTKFVKSSLAE